MLMLILMYAYAYVYNMLTATIKTPERLHKVTEA